VRAAESTGRTAPLAATAENPATCSSTPTALVDQATITLDGDWAEVTVPRCAAPTITAAPADVFPTTPVPGPGSRPRHPRFPRADATALWPIVVAPRGEEHEGVQEGENAEPRGGLAEQIGR
jgi:hypothetical protein